MLNYDHLVRMTKEHGLVQFSQGPFPNTQSGYTLDDNARAAILTLMMPEIHRKQLFPYYVHFMEKATQHPTLWHNVMLESGGFEQAEQASSDSRGRAFLAYCLINNQNPVPDTPLYLKRLLQGILPIWETSSLRARSYILLGINSVRDDLIENHSIQGFLQGIRNDIISHLMDGYKKNHSSSWKWYENTLTYCNGILPHALLSCPKTPENQTLLTVARDSLLFLCDILFREGYLNIIGNQGWFTKGQNQPPLFDQQPVDAASIALACLAAYQCFGEEIFLEFARKARNWFTGENIHRLSLIDPETGGCFDALTESGVNQNQGAESLLAYLLTFCATEKYCHEETPSC